MTHIQETGHSNTGGKKVSAPPKRNHIQRSFAAGINQPQVIPNKKLQRRAKHKLREVEYDSD
jgi:hypothetical protein